MGNIKITNTFDKGMNQDALNYLQPQGTYRYAKNMVKGDRHALGYGLSTEESDTEITSIGEVVGAYYVESINSTVLFVLPGSIYLFDHETEKATFVASDSEFGCDWKFSSCEYISATFKTDQPCNELKAYFSSGCEFFVVNITELQNPVRKAGLIESIKNEDNTFCELTCDHFKIFKCVCAPTITPITSDRGGHRLVSGTYQFVAQLEDNGGNKTNWFKVSDPVSVASENNQPGEMSLSSIKVHITDLDCRYDKVNIAVIQTVEGINTAQIVATRHYNTDGITFTYTGQTGREISLLEIQTKRKMWLQGRDVAQKDSRLFLYNIRQQKNLNMQRRVLEEAKLSFQMTGVTPKMVEMHGMRTLIRDENYMFGVVYNYCDGTHSNAFVMRPNPVDGCGGGSASSGSFSEPSGKAQEYFRPRGGNSGDGAPVGCASGNCGGSSAGGGGGLENRGTSNTEEEQNEESTIIESWSTEVDNMVEAAKCDDCQEPHCCETDDEGNVSCVGCGESNNCAGCEQDEIAYANDLPKLQNLFTLHTDQITNENQDNTTDITSTDFITAAKNLIDSIDNSEFHKIKKENFDINVVVGGGSGGAGNSTEAAERGTGNSSPSSAIWSDEFTNGKGVYLLEDTPKVVGCFAPKVQTSTEKYPDSKDCDGEYLFGSFANQNVQLFRTPSVEEAPIITATATGVPSPHSSTQPTDSVMINLLGVIAQVPEPTEEDLPKPLCPNNPWTLVIIPRDEINSTVQAKGIGFGTITGKSAGDDLIYGRHAANSRTNVERWIDNGGSRKGSTDGPGMFFYGIDTEIGKAALSGRTFRDEGLFRGMGYRYGLYEEGQKPAEALTGRRVDQRGATQAINLNILQPRRSENNISAVGYLEANKGGQTVQGAQHKVCTLHRESCVYIDAGINIPTDSSFTTDTLDHACPIPNAHGVYGAVVREIEDQYGAITGMSFVKSGLEGRGFGTYQGVIGDSFIGPYTFVRQSFVSDKVGNTYNTPERVRTVCDSPNDLILQNLGIDFYSTQLPVSGDRSDAKNWAGGHEDAPWFAAHGVEPEFDYYYPKTQRTLITTWVESRINPFLRATGYGDAEKTVEVFYPKLKGLHTAASESTSKHPWEKSFLNLFIHYKVEQPSVAQLTRLAIVRNIIFFVIPMLGLDKLGEITGVVDGLGTMLTFPLLYAYWYAMKNLITRNDYLHKMLGLPVCKTDDAGGENDNSIDGFRNNYYAYNYDHSALNYANVYQAIPANYNTCDCSLCLWADTDIVMADSSRKKIKDVQVGDLVSSYDFDTKEYVIKPVKRVIDTGNQKVYRIHLKNQTYIDATANHKWFVRKHKKKEVIIVSTLDLIENIKSNELRGYNYDKFRIASAPNYTPLYNNYDQDIITEDEAYILGMYVAEGNKYGGGVFISQFKLPTRKKIKEHLERTDFIWSETTNGFYISKLLAQHDLFLSVGNGACNKKLPEVLFTQSLPILLKLREGLMDGDGSTAPPSAANHAYRDFYYTCSKQLEYDFRYLSFLIGKPGYTYSNIRSGFGSENMQHTVHCHQNPKANTGFLGILSIEEHGVVPTYDIEVEDTHAFILADSGVITHNCTDDATTNEIYYSNKQIQGSPIDFYKQFGALSFESLPHDLGKLRKLFTVNGNFFAHTEDFIVPLNFKDVSNGALTVQNAAMGGYLTFGDPDSPLFEGVQEGILGNTDPNAAINTPMGYLFVDREARKIYLFGGSGGPVALSSVGMDRFFKEYIDFCQISDCHDEKSESGTYYTMGYDPRYNRVLFTKKDGIEKGSFTLSLDLSTKEFTWVSFHDYIPKLYFNDRANIYNIKDGKIYKQNTAKTYRNFHGKEFASEIEFVAVAPDGESFTYESTTINTEAEKDNRRNLDITFNKIAAYNTTQGTGTLTASVIGDNKDSVSNMNIKITENGKIKLNKIKRAFRFNNIKDNTKSSCKEEVVLLLEDCNPIPAINESIFDCSPPQQQSFKNAVLADDHITYRMTFDQDDKTIVKLLSVKTEGDKEII